MSHHNREPFDFQGFDGSDMKIEEFAAACLGLGFFWMIILIAMGSLRSWDGLIVWITSTIVMTVLTSLLIWYRPRKSKTVNESDHNPHALNQLFSRGSYGKGWVYILKDVDISGYYKIGKTYHLKDRMVSFGVMLPIQTELILTIPCTNPSKVESALHTVFASKRKRGEWFALEQPDLDWIRSQDFES